MTRHFLTRVRFHGWPAAALWLMFASASYAQQPAIENRASDRSAITGNVVTRDGEPVTSAYVSISRIGPNTFGNIKVDGNGQFKSEPLDAGLYRVSAFAPGYVSEPQVNSPGYYHPGDAITLTLIKGGVITGKVMNSENAPVVAANVRAIRVRDQNGKPLSIQGITRERFTDDRGIYRLYGLPAGSYVVSAGGPQRFTSSAPPTQYETQAPTYSPSSTRDTATEITLNSGDEITMDIQYRGEPGHSVSGKVVGAASSNEATISYGVSVSLLDLRSRMTIMNATANAPNNFAFALYGVPDGEYEVNATQGSQSRDNLSSGPKRITVQGSDITGLNLNLAPLASIQGRLVLETDPKTPCAKRRATALPETIMFARRFQPETGASKTAAAGQPEVSVLSDFSGSESMIDGQGNFSFKNLQAGTYKIDPREPASGWYIRSMTMGPPAKPLNVAHDGINVKASERIAGVTVTFREGAGKLRGRISLGEGQSLPATLRVYLVPSEPDSTENVLRFYEARPESNGSFTVDNLAPGKYLVVARPVEETDLGTTKSIRMDSGFRTKVLSDAQASKKEVGFTPCEQISDYALPFVAPATSRQ